MKGFMHIVEVLLIVLLVFFVFAQFANIPSISDDWSRTKLGLMGKDVLMALEKKGIDWFDKTEVEYELNRTIPENMIYSLRLENVIKPGIEIGCLCDNDEMYILENDILYPKYFFINDEKVEFNITQITNKDALFSLDFDVALVYGYEDFSANPSQVNKFLEYDKGIVEICDKPAIDSVQNTIFGLDYGETESGDFEIKFSSMSMENGKELNKIYDYFFHIPVFYDMFKTLIQWDEWFGSEGAEIVQDEGRSEPSVKLTGSDCLSMNTLIYTDRYESFKRGEIDFDVNLADNAVLFVGFGRYFASISDNETTGYDSFYDRSMNPKGSNTMHLTESGEWNHIKVVVEGGELILYNNGEKVANAFGSVDSPSNISIFNLCGEAYVDNLRITHETIHRFDNENENFLDKENTTTAQSRDRNRILLEERGTLVPACIINYNIGGVGKGRTVWLSNHSSYDSDYKTLVKSLIAWAAGDKYRMIKSDIKRPFTSRIYRPLNKDMFQNVKIVLELGYLY